ncbi:hypothetical protein M501DRAFT_996986 [Patellaria atrata CBS 101060]|uniref:Uncharacterized protein n=1 Tax=Patellaria atrata CBS 101060 TaxID=1346257 RepID=A0A9P4S4V1_9PEZI|nr:hypothetical protein M501DRAFT_996986 [Patellaria atrata CBS 101060]
MSDQSPTGPSQPSKTAAYTQSSNPTTSAPAEDSTARQTAKANTDPENHPVEHRGSHQQDPDAAVPASLGRGVRGAGSGEDATEEEVGRHRELEGEQLAAPGEGEVAEAVRGQGDRGATEQAPLREKVKEKRESEVDVAGVLGQTGGPANPVGKDDYPNKGD